MARLNEPSVSMDSFETYRKKMLRQNRDLAKSNNVRALRIRELENECACMLSENLELRGRILELEAQVEDNEARRIADHALAIRDKLESQLTEWGTMLAGLGLEPPMKKHSPRIRKPIKQRMSFHGSRLSPSQRRLREIAKDVEELGHIAETKTSPRKSMNPQQIQALREEAIEAEAADSSDLGPPPTSAFIDQDPVKIDSPKQAIVEKQTEPQRKVKLDAIMALPSPKPEKRGILLEQKPPTPSHPHMSVSDIENQASLPIKAGSKRKFGGRDDGDNTQFHITRNENETIFTQSERAAMRQRAGGKTLKEHPNIRKEAREKPDDARTPRKPLAVKNTNADVTSPKKNARPRPIDDLTQVKSDMVKSKGTQGRSKLKAKTNSVAKIRSISPPTVLPTTTTELASELGVPVPEPPLLSPCSPEAMVSGEIHRGDTPPPADISSKGETSRPSRRNRASVSYAEPNLRDKMRRPTKELSDAVAGEGKYSRRSSQFEELPHSSARVKRESDAGDSWKASNSAKALPPDAEPDSIPASPLARKAPSPNELPNSVVTERRGRPSTASKAVASANEAAKGAGDTAATANDKSNTSGAGNTDVYEFTSSSPQADKIEDEGENEEPVLRRPRRQSAASRRSATAMDSEGGFSRQERSTRRRSMMV